MSNKENSQFDKYLKEKLQTDVQIDSAFKTALKEKLILEIDNVSTNEQHKSKFNSKGMSNLISKLKSLPKLSYIIAGVGVTALVGVVTVFLLNQGKVDDKLTPIDKTPTAIAQLYINEGSVTIIRDEQEQTYTADTEIFANDKIATAQDTIADIKTAYGRVALDVNSSITVQNDGFPTVNDGTVFISSNNDYTQQISSATEYAEIFVEKGATLITHTPEIVVEAGIFPKAYAENEGQTKIISVTGKVTVKVNNESKTLENGEQIIVTKDKATNLVPKEEIDKEQFKTDFFTTVKAKETEENKDLGLAGDLTPPTITITAPANGSTTQANTTTVKFTSNEDGWYYNDGWKEMVKDTEVSYSVTLQEGANTITVKAKDRSYNVTTASVSVTYTPVVPVEAKITLTGKAVSDGVSLSWTVTGLNTDKGFKIVKSTEINPVYPGNDYQYLTDGSTRTYKWKITDGQTYYFRVCQYDGNGKCLRYSNNLKLTAPTSTPDTTTTISLTGNHTTTGITVNWTVTAGEATAFKVCKSLEPNPVYPGSDCAYITSGTTHTWNVTDGKTYYVRVGKYEDGKVTVYSNQITVTAPN